MALTPEEKQALIRVLGGKFIDLCGSKDKVGLSLTYHRVKSYEYPALVVHCNGKRRKVHINRAEWQAFLYERERIRAERLIKSLKSFSELKLYPENASLVLWFLREAKELSEKSTLWEFLFQNRDRLPPDTFPRWKFEDDSKTVEIWDLWGTKELRITLTEFSPVRGKIQRREGIPYLCKEGKTYVLSAEPLRVLKIHKRGIEVNNRWIVRKTDKGLFVDLRRL